jgi:NADH-quinone oxidoreductase subunit L
MLIVVLTISSLVHVYSVFYMFYDKNSIKFMSYLTAFTLFMVILVTSGNFVVMFLG